MDGISLNQIKTAIAKFVQMPDEDWNLFTPLLSYSSLKKGEHWISEGQREHYLGFVLEGNMRHYYTRDGEEKTTYFYFENHLVGGYLSCLTGTPSLLTIEAMTDCKLLKFPYQGMVDLYNQSKYWERFGRIVAEYIAKGLEERMTGLLMLSPEERYLELIKSNKQKIIERIPQHYIANYLGITPVSLSRIRNRQIKK